MKIRSFFLTNTLLFSAFSIGVSAAEPLKYQDIAQLRENVRQHVKNHFLHLDANLKEGEDLFIDVGNLDSRLKLRKCDKFLTLKLTTPPHQSNRGTVKTSCESGKRWTIYIPVQIDIHKEVIVAAKDLPRGSVVTAQDLQVMQLSTSNFGVGLALSSQAESVYGMELVRPLRAGNPVNTKYLKKPNIIAKGDPVTLEAGTEVLNVSVGGVALDDGHLGKRIRVRNKQSKKIVNGLVVAPGKVSIAAH